ncbi:hypothetical protein L3X38_025083 [Prunus dulcis]|uniref:Uncharacterized protein n=1 Tax=Prunus dulcis TaxID=3755 RepID=A0AAD4W0Z8_PRUDU|nr:hypothetical protein L3X38_025083 [Prunus dulcis]
MTPVYEYLADETLPIDTDAALRLQLQFGRYTIINKQLYKRGYALPYLRFGLPRILITNNGCLFDNARF